MAQTADPSTRSNDFYAALKSRKAEIEARYRAASPTSAELFERARALFPGGYTRDAVIRDPYPPFIESGEGSTLVDADGRRLTDFWFNATSLPLGHAHWRVVAATEGQVKKGSAYFAPTRNELKLAETLCQRIPSADRIRFANSGSEAVMVALRMARSHTGRDLVVKFEGSYHGIYDDVQWSVSPSMDRIGPAGEPVPVADTAGLPSGEGRVLVLPYNDPDALRRALQVHGDKVAAVIIEPMANRIGLILPDKEFLEAAREACDASGAVLIFDEVIAFRLGYNGAQGTLGVTPDLTTLGKLIGGGFPVGAVAGREHILAVTEPDRSGRMSHSGTFNANPVTVVAGQATLDELTPQAFDRLNAAGARIRVELARLCEGLPLRVTGAGSLFKVNATPRDIRSYRDTLSADKEWENVASLALLVEGFFLTGRVQGCLSLATTDEQIDAFLAAFETLVMG